LLGLLREKRAELARRLRAPLQKHLERHQVLIFTCHPAAWRDLGVQARSIGP
jgi:hypothetical protein